MRPGIRERIHTFLADRGLRKTLQREAIIQAAFSTTDHYTAEELLRMSRKIDRSVSRATVYRTLPLLVECGVLKEMDFGKDHKFYDPNYLDGPKELQFETTTQTFTFEPTFYFKGGAVTPRAIYRGFFE